MNVAIGVKCEWQVRRWDPFFNDYNMIPISCTSLERAFDVAVDEAAHHFYQNLFSADEYQIWHETDEGWQMYGFIDWGTNGEVTLPHNAMWAEAGRLLYWLVEVFYDNDSMLVEVS